MTTVKQIERSWASRNYERLYRDMISCRPEAGLSIDFDGDSSAPAAAMAMIWMDELSQSHAPLYSQLLRSVLASQLPDGSWGDLGATALCLRALLCGRGQGEAVERGVAFFAKLQKDQGLWPRFPLRRMPEDAAMSAFVLYELGDQPAFREGVRMADALRWFESNERFLDDDARKLWQRAARRCRTGGRTLAMPVWSEERPAA
jgi:hypothetical protein